MALRHFEVAASGTALGCRSDDVTTGLTIVAY